MKLQHIKQLYSAIIDVWSITDNHAKNPNHDEIELDDDECDAIQEQRMVRHQCIIQMVQCLKATHALIAKLNKSAAVGAFGMQCKKERIQHNRRSKELLNTLHRARELHYIIQMQLDKLQLELER